MATTKRSNKPFGKALKTLLRQEQVSQRELTRRCEARGWGSLGSTSQLVNELQKPTFWAMERIAICLQVDPEYFADYRLMKMRRLLDPDVVGIKTAVKNLSRFEMIEQAADVEESPPAAPGRRGAAKGRSESA